MVNVKSVDKIQLEYDLFDVSDSFYTVSNMANLLLSDLEEIDVSKSSITCCKRKNCRKKVISNALGKYANKFGYFEPKYYEMDNFYLHRKSIVLDSFKKQLSDIYLVLDEGNFHELFKLLIFSRAKAMDYRRNIEDRRDALRHIAEEGISIEDQFMIDESDNFSSWFDKTLSSITCDKNVEKVKQGCYN